jgi:hypothetical protein
MYTVCLMVTNLGKSLVDYSLHPCKNRQFCSVWSQVRIGIWQVFSNRTRFDCSGSFFWLSWSRFLRLISITRISRLWNKLMDIISWKGDMWNFHINYMGFGREEATFILICLLFKAILLAKSSQCWSLK